MFKRLITSHWLAIIEILILIIVSFYFINSWQEIKPLKKEYQKLKVQLESLNKENQLLQQKINYLSLESNLEKEIKKRLGLGYQNEKFMIFNEPINEVQEYLPNNFFISVKKLIKKILP